MHVLVSNWHQCFFFFYGGEVLPNVAPEKYDFNLYKVPFMGKKNTPNSSNFEEKNFKLLNFYEKFQSIAFFFSIFIFNM
jgi:hypothetical protein